MPLDKFIILRSRAYKEGDLLVDGLNKDGERKTFIAKNALKSKKRFAGGVLEPINYVELYYTEKTTRFSFLQEGKIQYDFPKIRENYEKIQMALYFLKLCYQATREGLPENQQIFDLLGNSLRVLETSSQPPILKAQFELKFLYYLGFSAPLEELKEFLAKPMKDHSEIPVSESKLQQIARYTRDQLRELSVDQ